jgi:uncharacterized protein (TIGR03066 family)
MKLSSRLAQLKRQKQVRQPAAPPVLPQGGTTHGKRWALVALCLVLAFGGTWGVLRYVVWAKVPAALVGTWEVTEGPMAGGTFAFARDGTLAIHAEDKGTDYIITGRVNVEGQAMLATTKDPRTRQEQTRTYTIRELTATSLVLELENGPVLRMVRRQ